MTELPQNINNHSFDANASWQRIQAKLKFQYGEATFNSWFKSMQLSFVSSNEVVLSVPTRFMREWVYSHYFDMLRQCWQEESASIVSVTVLVRDASMQDASTAVTEEHQEAISAPLKEESASISSVQPGWDDEFSVALDPRYTFENFVVGTSNELAHAAAHSVADSESVIPGSNPLFIYGGVGLGKTHLMHAIASHIRKKHPNRKVVYLSAEKFMYLFVRALKNKDIVTFKERLRSVEVLLIDDIQFICGKNSTQEEFFHTFNALIDHHRQLVISGDRSPSDLDGMEERVRSRLGWGLVADINTTTYELRLGILETKLEQMNVSVPRSVLEFLARKITSNVRELEGALNKVVAHSNLFGRAITMETTQTILQDLLRSHQRTITIDDIKKVVADHCHIKISDMHSARRSRMVARPRQIAMYIAKKLTPHSLPEIGRQFGGKDHTTVIHAVRKIEELSSAEQEFREDVERMMHQLQS